jgi:serine/threonine-protein kinase
MAEGTRRPGELPPLPQPRRVESQPAVPVAPVKPSQPVAPVKPPPPPPPAPARVDPLINTVIGSRYRIIEHVGKGGMATVYRAEHQLLHKSVAVKVLLPELLGEGDMAARFEREAIAAARLDHPNLVSITDFGTTGDGQLYLVMEFLEGTPLDEIIDQGPLPAERAVEITRQLLRGLAHAHDAGVVHRDLKPSNVMVQTHGGREVAKIIDFGIAKMVGGAAAGPHVETQAGIVFGTADFLAPERLLGKSDSDPRSDLYAVGVVLYEMLTGERPFHDPDPYVVVRRALAEEPKPPSTLVAAVPAALDAIVSRALAKEPGERYPGARDFLAALDPFARRPATSPVAEQGSLPGPDEVTTALTPVSARRPWLFVGLAVLAAVLVVVVAALSGSRSSGPSPVLPAPAAVDPEKQLAVLVTRAGEADTVAERQSAFDRLVAFGYLDRVPWVPMLSKDLAQLPTCEERREALLKLEKVHDPRALPALEEAAARGDNACLAADAQRASAALRGQPASATAPAAPTAPTAPPAAAQRKPRRSGGGGGHF